MVEDIQIAQREGGASSTLRRPPRITLVQLILLCLLALCAPFLVGSCSPQDVTAGCDPYGEIADVLIDFRAEGSGLITRSGSSDTPSFVRAVSLIRRIDVFIYDADMQGSLDSWHSFDVASAGTVSMTSRTGRKRVVVLANMNPDRLTKRSTASYDAICGLKSLLTDDHPDYPVMSGETVFEACEGKVVEVVLTPLMSRILLSSVSADFGGTQYSGQLLRNASAYLINVNSSCEVLRSEEFAPEVLLNSGGLVDSDVASLKNESMLYRKLGDIGRSRTYFMNDFVCYPNDIAEESLGRPFTRFVLQGDIAGKTWYYPVNLNQKGFGYSLGSHGIGRNIYHVLDLTVTRTGSTDPDIVIGGEDVETKGWIELHPGNIVTGHDGDTIHIYVDVYPEETMVDICREDLDYDVERGIYEYELDPDGHGVWLTLLEGGTGMFTIDAGPPVNAGFLVIVVCNP